MPPTQFSMLVEAKGEKGDIGSQVRTFGQPELFSETGCVQMLQEKKIYISTGVLQNQGEQAVHRLCLISVPAVVCGKFTLVKQ